MNPQSSIDLFMHGRNDLMMGKKSPEHRAKKSTKYESTNKMRISPSKKTSAYCRTNKKTKRRKDQR